MVFSSITFLSIFLPVVFILNLVIRNLKVRNGMLLVASLVFYAYGEPIYVLLMILSGLWNYLLALGIHRAEETRKGRKAFLVAAICLNIGMLVVFKYTGMLVQTFNTLTGLGLPAPAIRLPIGAPASRRSRVTPKLVISRAPTVTVVPLTVNVAIACRSHKMSK